MMTLVSLSRNILLTGDYDRFNETDNGWHSLNVEELIQMLNQRFQNAKIR